MSQFNKKCIFHANVQDEPTNNLDIESIDALSEAINEYKGGMFFFIYKMIDHKCHSFIFCCE